MAGELGFEYNILEGFWQKWMESELRELVEYSALRKVKIWVRKHGKDLRDEESRRKFFAFCQDRGVAGAKIDFFDSEAKEIVDLIKR